MTPPEPHGGGGGGGETLSRGKGSSPAWGSDGGVKTRAGGKGSHGGQRGEEKEEKVSFSSHPLFHVPLSLPQKNNNKKQKKTLSKPGKKQIKKKKPTKHHHHQNPIFSLKIPPPAVFSPISVAPPPPPSTTFDGNRQVCHQLWGKCCHVPPPARRFWGARGLWVLPAFGASIPLCGIFPAMPCPYCPRCHLLPFPSHPSS